MGILNILANENSAESLFSITLTNVFWVSLDFEMNLLLVVVIKILL